MTLSRVLMTSLFVAALSTSLFSSEAEAVFCNPLSPPPPRFVGNMAGDPVCTDDNIQDAINYVAAQHYSCPVTIYITPEHTYTSQHLTFNNTGENITLVGQGAGAVCGPPPQYCDPTAGSCNNPAPTAPLLTISASHTSGSVIHLNGANSVTLLYLTIENGAAAYNANGGGIYFSGIGSLTLNTSTVQNNYAGFGAGIYFNGTGGNATLTLNSNSLIVGNEAQFSGGGIRIDGTSLLFALHDQTTIANNQADGHDPILNTAVEGYGGGLEIVGPARADLASAGYGGLGVIYNNTALYGGGAAVFGADSDSSGTGALVLFTVDAHNPVRIQGNTASNTGGGVFLRPNLASAANFANLCAYDFRMDDNIAQEGTAIYSDAFSSDVGSPYGGDVDLNTPCKFDAESLPSLGAVACASGVICNSLDGNIAEDQFSQPTAGATILLQDNSSFDSNRLILRHNTGGYAIRAFDPLAGNKNCLLVDNTLTGEVFRMDYDGDIASFPFYDCTIANNTLGGPAVFYAGTGANLTVSNSIIDQPGFPTFDTGGGGGLTLDYLLSNDITTMPVQGDIFKGEPTFVNVAAGDYHLQATSLGIDIGPASGGSDLDRVPRDIDLAPAPNVFGPRDLGAYERQFVCASDTFFCNGFETYQ